MTKPTVSVLVPCYAQALYLGEAIASLQEQTLDSWEAIVVAQDPSSIDVARSYAHLDMRIRVIEQAPLGVAAARNRAAREAQAQWLLPLDADDMLTPKCLEKLTQVMPATEYAMAYGDLQIFGNTSGEWCPVYSRSDMREQNCLPNTTMHSRALWKTTGGWDETLICYEDWAYWVGCSSCDPQVAHLFEKLYLYRRRVGSMSTTFPGWHHVHTAMVHTLYPEIYPPSPQDRLTIARGGAGLLDRLKEKLERYPDHAMLRLWVGLIEGTCTP